MGKKKKKNENVYQQDIDLASIQAGAVTSAKNVAAKGAIAIAAATVAGAFTSGFESLYWGIKPTVKEIVSPTPYKVKTSRFGFSKVMKQNPFTFEWSDYTGDQKPVNKKAIKLY